jgi:hypothetical protein
MPIGVKLTDLSAMHPRLLWEEISAAAAAVLMRDETPKVVAVPIDVQDLPDLRTVASDRVSGNSDSGLGPLSWRSTRDSGCGAAWQRRGLPD